MKTLKKQRKTIKIQSEKKLIYFKDSIIRMLLNILVSSNPKFLTIHIDNKSSERTLYIVMEYVEKDLNTFCKDQNPSEHQVALFSN